MQYKQFPRGRMLEGADYIEIVNEDIEVGKIKFALFDFDGTISLIREGWQEVMIPMMVDILVDLDSGETREEIHDIVLEFVTRLTGKQTIYQMMEFAENVKKRGGEPKAPVDYKWDYLNLLFEQIKDRIEGIKEGRLDLDEMSVAGSLDMVKALHDRGVTLYLASGTDKPYVLDESESLGLHPYFGKNIYGAIDDFENYSKAMVIDDIIRSNDLQGVELAGFGDGYVEIEETKKVGGIAVGMAVDEKARAGIDEWKRNRLIEYGADIIVPDFREWDKLVAFLFGECEK